MEAIASRVEAITTSNKKLLVAKGIATSDKGILTMSNKRLLGTMVLCPSKTDKRLLRNEDGSVE